MRWIQRFINPGTLYLQRPNGRGRYIILGLINPGIHRIGENFVYFQKNFKMIKFSKCFKKIQFS
jgi:hypothetical protein